MDPRQLRALGFAGIVIALVLCVYYVLRTYKEGETQWYFLVMAMGILLLLSYQMMSNGNRRR